MRGEADHARSRLVWMAQSTLAAVPCVAVSIYVAYDTGSVSWGVMSGAVLAVLIGVVLGAVAARRDRRDRDNP